MNYYYSIIYLNFYIYVDSFICVNYHFLKCLLQFLRDTLYYQQIILESLKEFSQNFLLKNKIYIKTFIV